MPPQNPAGAPPRTTSKVREAEALTRANALFRGLGDAALVDRVVFEKEDVAAFRGLLQKGSFFD